MNPSTLPTPFDIAPPPPVAYVPGELEWMGLVVALAALLLLALLRRPRPQRKDFIPLHVCMQALDRLKPDDPSALLQLHKLLKALLSEITGRDMRSLTANEIAPIAGSYAQIVDVCKQIESALYQSQSSTEDISRLLVVAKDALVDASARPGSIRIESR